MAAPVATARVDPVGIKLKEGAQCFITFAVDPDISFWEIDVQPPGVDGGDPIDNTTQHNDNWETQRAAQLKKLTDGNQKVAYDPAVLTQIVAIVNVETTVTIKFGENSTWAEYGWLASFIPDPMVRRQMPTATIRVCFSAWDHVNNVEAGPTLVSVAGT